MKIIAEHAANKALKRDALQLSAEAKLAKKNDPSVIDGTLGTFYYEDGSFSVHKTISKKLNEINDMDKYLYSTAGGTDEFHDAIMNWFFQKSRGVIENSLCAKSIPTPGGTGALVASVNNATNYGETVLIPNPCWGPYVGICESRGRKVEKYTLFDGDKFNLNSLKETASKVIEKQNRLVCLINDPCNNPTGYTMTEEELTELIEYFNSLDDTPVVMVYDAAYIDMAKEGIDATRKKLEVFAKANENVIIIVAMSLSKTFFVYGQRLGAQIILGKNEAEVKEFKDAGSYFARNTWSNCNKGLTSLMISLNKDSEALLSVKEEISKVVEELDTRGKIFMDEAKECGLKTLPYSSGFFISVPCKNNNLILDKLVEEEKIHLIPIAGCVRVAVCALPTKDIKGLASKIKKVIDKYDN